MKHTPEGNTAILSTPPSMFPSSNGQITIDSSPVPAIGESCSCGDPGIDHQACAGIELIWLTGRIEWMKSVQQSGGGDLSGMLWGRSRPSREAGWLIGKDREAVRHGQRCCGRQRRTKWDFQSIKIINASRGDWWSDRRGLQFLKGEMVSGANRHKQAQETLWVEKHRQYNSGRWWASDWSRTPGGWRQW